MSITDNPVSITIDEEESFTVPSGDVLKVTIVAKGSVTGDGDTSIRVNGVAVAKGRDDRRTANTVLIGGDEVSSTGPGATCHIGGFSL